MTDAKKIPSVLIVEDEAIVALDLKTLITKMNFNVIDVVATGADAIEHAVLKKPDVILMDIILRGPMDGIEAALHIRGKMSVPIIFSTANADQATMVKSHSVDHAFYIFKPVDRHLLQDTILQALESKK